MKNESRAVGRLFFKSWKPIILLFTHFKLTLVFSSTGKLGNKELFGHQKIEKFWHQTALDFIFPLETTVKLGFKERLNSEQIGISEQFCDDQKVPYYQI